MLWLKLIWWTFWRGLLYGGISGIILGTLFAPFAGTIYGVLIGTLMGAFLGLLNGVSLAAMTHLLFMKQPLNRSEYIDCTRILAIHIDFVLTLTYGASAFGFWGVIPALLVAVAAFTLSPHFADYVAEQLADLPRRSLANG